MEKLSLKITDMNKHISQIKESNAAQNQKQKEKIAKAAKDFESIFTAMLLQSMTKTTNGLFGEEGYGNDIFDTLFEQEIASYISQGKSLGIAEALYKKITGEDMSPELKVKLKSTEKIEVKVNENTDIPKIQPSTESLNRLKRFEDIIEDASKEFGIDKNVIKSIILAESAANHRAVSPVKAKGLMQLMDSTAAEMGVRNVFDPKENIYGGTKYLAKMLRQYNGDLKLALAAYNAGPQNVEKYKGVPPFEETQNYITKVMSYLNHFSENES
ncbi:transglycosylase SLT domain-containing protein [Rosettibacter firmus]|uniref:transglycosylase SLT domain-containing protein n=1 Tax=Rosettibacter firmus TaxID=3111522 RepID=UPI00336BD6DF